VRELDCIFITFHLLLVFTVKRCLLLSGNDTNCGCSETKRCGRFEVYTAVTMKNAVFGDVTPCSFLRTDVSEETSPPSSGLKESAT
jgi:hypothetical protein